MRGVQAEEELNIAHRIRLRAEHVAEKEVAELDWVEAGEQEAPDAFEEPLAAFEVEEAWYGTEEQGGRELYNCQPVSYNRSALCVMQNAKPAQSELHTCKNSPQSTQQANKHTSSPHPPA